MSGESEKFQQRIIESIDGGHPVIGFGVVGPPEACIITGYDDGGEVLIGWSLFQEHLDPTHDISGDDEDDMKPPTHARRPPIRWARGGKSPAKSGMMK